MLDDKAIKAFKEMLVGRDNIQKVKVNMVCSPERLAKLLRGLKDSKGLELVVRRDEPDIDNELLEFATKLKGATLSFYEVNPKFRM